ncbi:MAG: G5 domain-containing protein [Armatimonadota bacterium]
MTSEHRNARRSNDVAGQLRFYRTTTVVLLLAVVVLAVMLIAGGRQEFARAIRIDGDLVCLVNDQDAAERVHEQLLAEGKGELPGNASLEQQWEDESWPVEDREVLNIPEAVKRLQEHGVTVQVSAWTIKVDGNDTVNLPSETFATDVLTRIKRQYVPSDEKPIESTFLEDVKIVEKQAPADTVLAELSEAVKALATTSTEAETYTVKSGDYPEKIAAAHGMTIDAFYRLNPQTRGATIHPGDKVKITPAMAGITVKTVTEVSETVDVEPEVEKVHSVNVPRGETRVASEGVPGKELRVKHRTYHNDRLVEEEIKSTQIVEPPSPRRVIVGTDDATSASGDDD